MGLEMGFLMADVGAVRAGEGDGVQGMPGVEVVFHAGPMGRTEGTAKALVTLYAHYQFRDPIGVHIGFYPF
jgi:hypothetical protein